LYQQLENTLESFQACAAMGCDAIELDVFRLQQDGTLIVFHGGTGTDDQNPGQLQDYFHRPGNIVDLTCSEVAALRFVPGHPEFPFALSPLQIRNGRIPTLEQVLRMAKATTNLQVKLELKGPDTVEPTLALVDRLDMVEQCSFSSFDASRLALLRQLKPEQRPRSVDADVGVDVNNPSHVYRTGWLLKEVLLPSDLLLLQAKALGVDEIHLPYDLCTPTLITTLHKAGLTTMAWMRGPIGMAQDVQDKYWDVGNEDERMYATLLRSGVQQVCVNKPDVLIGMFPPRNEEEEPQSPQ
jgi:glycerophosphoryl diester phosphodiesterase